MQTKAWTCIGTPCGWLLVHRLAAGHVPGAQTTHFAQIVFIPLGAQIPMLSFMAAAAAAMATATLVDIRNEAGTRDKDEDDVAVAIVVFVAGVVVVVVFRCRILN